MKEVIRQEERERLKESAGVNRARSRGTLGEGRHLVCSGKRQEFVRWDL